MNKDAKSIARDLLAVAQELQAGYGTYNEGGYLQAVMEQAVLTIDAYWKLEQALLVLDDKIKLCDDINKNSVSDIYSDLQRVKKSLLGLKDSIRRQSVVSHNRG